ncbi:hypothetical protein ACO2Q8_20655 [Larkinella sp. VNQ87]|uniref:hypothetical protein n=1 Tax=Larkinella sp. VNQ87 TaxID=3400921 RepID=UPI003C0693A6
MQKNWTAYLELAARYYVLVVLNLYGWGKIMGGQFYRPGHFPDKVAQIPLAEASGFDLTWAFFGHSPFYIWFIGLSQVIGAWLLVAQKTKLLGVAILIPVLLNIVVVDSAFQISAGALSVAAFCLLLLLLILLLNQSTLRALFEILWQPAASEKQTVKVQITKVFIVLGLIALLFGLQSFVVLLIGE